MTRVILTVAATFAGLAFGLQPATADFYGAPWCAVVSMGDGDMQWDCEYQSLESCRPNVLAGNRGWCHPNPYPIASYRSADDRHHKKRRTHTQ